ncbi:MAG: 30S ribosomal protein S20 [Anaerolineales bacterium]
MANTLSAKKRIRQNEKRHQRNQTVRTRTRTFTKRARQAIEAGEVEAAEKAVKDASSQLDKAVSKGVIHENNAARRKSRLMKQLARIQEQS